MQNTTHFEAFFFTMSIQIISMVWNCTALQEHSEVLVMMALADWANDRGECFPSIYTLCRKARINERTWKRIKPSLIERGFIEVDEGKGVYTKLGHTNIYRIKMESLDNRGDMVSPPGGVMVSPHIRQSYPSEDIYITPAAAAAASLLEREAKKKKTRPADFEEVRQYVVEKLKLPIADAQWLWEKWVGNGFKNDGRLMADWRATASTWERMKSIFPSHRAARGFKK